MLVALSATNSYEIVGIGAIDVTKACEFEWFGYIHGPKPYTCIGFRWAFISQTPADLDASRTQHHDSSRTRQSCSGAQQWPRESPTTYQEVVVIRRFV